MKIVFVTNFYNHHQKPLADALHALIGDGYSFIETRPITEERLKMGWGKETKPAYVLQNYSGAEAKSKCQELIDTADVVILGSAPYALLKTRLKKGRLTFLYSERIYKTGLPILQFPLHLLRAVSRYLRFKNFYVLCASAYTPLDFSKIFAFVNKTYKWAYFTEVKTYDDIDHFIETKTPASLLWVARFLELKHPEAAIEVAKRLKQEQIPFTLNMIGSGDLEENIRQRVQAEQLEDCVHLLGAMPPEKVRTYMEQSEIFLFTSDKNEGWGAVLNESMNSACAVVANSAIGAVPFLVKDQENGFMYPDGDVDALYNKVKQLLKNETERKRIAKNAYSTMVDEWNAENAATKFLLICERMLSGEYKPFPYETGVCSKAEILKDNWMK